MPIPVKCTCGKKYNVADKLAGQLIFCPNCQLSLDVPAPDFVPTVDEVEVVDDEEDAGPGTYDVTKQVDDGVSMAAAAAGSFSGSIGRVKTAKEATCLAYSAQNRYALAGLGRDLLILEPRGNKKKGRFEGHEVPVTTLAFMPNTQGVLSGDERGGLLLWEVETQRVLRRLRGHKGPVNACAIAPNGKYAISGGEDGAVRMWDLGTGEAVDLLDARFEEVVTAVNYSQDGKMIAAGCDRGRVAVWSVRTGERLYKMRAGREPVETLLFSPDNSEIIAAGFSKVSQNGVMAYRWLSSSGQKLPTFTNPSTGNAKLFCMALVPHGRRVLVGFSRAPGPGGYELNVGASAAATGGSIIGGLIGGALGVDAGGFEVVAVFDQKGGDKTNGLQSFTVEGGVRGQDLGGVDRPVVGVAISPDSTRALCALEEGDLAFFALSP